MAMVVPLAQNLASTPLRPELTQAVAAGSLDATCQWALRNLDRPIGLAESAEQANLSESTLLRRFQDEIPQRLPSCVQTARIAATLEQLNTRPREDPRSPPQILWAESTARS